MKSSELSTQYAYSEISESALQLRADLTESMHVSLENSVKNTINTITINLMEKYFDASLASKDRNAIQAVCKKLVHIQEKIFDSKVT